MRPRRWKRLVASLSTTIGLTKKIPPYYVEKPQRIALHFEVLLGLVKVLASQSDTERLDRTFWFERAQPAIAKAEAILVGAHEPD